MTCRSSQFAAWNATRKATGYRSGLEVRLASLLDKVKRFFQAVLYERVHIPYQVVVHNRYTPDWVLLPQHIAVEAKGQFSPTDRQKMLHVQAAHPTLDLRLVLQHPHTRLSRASATTYATWCDKHGFPWCAAADFPPSSWLTHKPTAASRKALMPYLKGLEP